jgi:hypothetical protein
MANRGGSRWRRRLEFGMILTPVRFGRRRDDRRMVRKREGCWQLRRSTTEPRAPRRRKSAASGFRSSATGVLKFNAHGPGGLIDRKAPGQAPRLNDEYRAALAAIVESGPIPAIHGVVRWRIVDLCHSRGVPYCGLPADAESRVAQDGIPQALGSSPPSCAGRRRNRGF